MTLPFSSFRSHKDAHKTKENKTKNTRVDSLRTLKLDIHFTSEMAAHNCNTLPLLRELQINESIRLTRHDSDTRRTAFKRPIYEQTTMRRDDEQTLRTHTAM